VWQLKRKIGRVSPRIEGRDGCCFCLMHLPATGVRSSP
jgi:hypothetical protein